MLRREVLKLGVAGVLSPAVLLPAPAKSAVPAKPAQMLQTLNWINGEGPFRTMQPTELLTSHVCIRDAGTQVLGPAELSVRTRLLPWKEPADVWKLQAKVALLYDLPDLPSITLWNTARPNKFIEPWFKVRNGMLSYDHGVLDSRVKWYLSKVLSVSWRYHSIMPTVDNHNRWRRCEYIHVIGEKLTRCEYRITPEREHCLSCSYIQGTSVP